MRYGNIAEGKFISRPNRFIAYVAIGGKTEKVHVKNTGRCRELLTEDAVVYLEKSGGGGEGSGNKRQGGRKRVTEYDLVAVEKGSRVVNVDSNAPNRAVGEWLQGKELFPSLKTVQAEKTYKNSRFDFYVETEEDRIFLEVKGVTLEKENVAYFPDAPSERAVKHVEELIEARKEGYGAYIVFVIQMEGVRSFSPNRETHRAFAEALERAEQAGVKVLAYGCRVTPDTMEIGEPVAVELCEAETDALGEGESGGQREGAERTEMLEEGESGGQRDCVGKPEVLEEGATEGLSGEPAAVQPAEPLTKRIVMPLLGWYDRGRRILPWRENPQPYYVWLSEIMLQQTRVEAVKPYFDRFIQNVPDIVSLAGLEEERLVKLWEGLGYYNRVRNLQKAAKIIVEEYGGRMPSEYVRLMELPGIGSYTAGAIASIAYGQAVPAVDGNVLRVLARLRMDDADILSQRTKARVEKELTAVMPAERAGDFNQALMELGAVVCLPNGEPKCDACPWGDFCRAYLAGRQQEFPKKKPKRSRTVEEKTVLVIRDGEKAAFYKRPAKGLLAGMYGFPMLDGYRTEEEVLEYLSGTGLKVIRIRPIGDAKHIFSHKEWHMKGYAVRVDELERTQGEGMAQGWVFIDREEARERCPIPSAYAAYARYLDIRLGI